MTKSTVANQDVDLARAGQCPAPTEAQPDRPLSPLPSDWTSLGRVFVSTARRYSARKAIADSLGAKLTYGETLLHSLLVARVLSRKLGDAAYVGILNPPMVPTVVANIAVTLLGKAAVNLNYGSKTADVNSAIKRCGITTVLATEKILAKSGIKPDAEVILIESLTAEVTAEDKQWAVNVATLVPETELGQYLPGFTAGLDDTATVLFTSGSTGEPKGVVLTHRNILGNVHQVSEHANLKPDNALIDVALGKMTFSHALGYTVTVWCILCLAQSAIYHPNPLEAKVIGPLMEQHGVTIMASTPTLMRKFLDRYTREQFEKVRWLLLGSEKLKPEIAHDIKEKLGKEPVEGFGCTQLSPVVAANVPFDVKSPDGRTVYGNRIGSVGQLVPGTTVKIREIKTGEVIPAGSRDVEGKYREGVIWVHGIQVMKEYLNNPEATARVVKNGWFNTEDVGYVDEDGFLWITDRLSNFAKIAGEMVPLGNVEAGIKAVTGVNEMAVSVTRLPDLERGEKVVVVYTDLGMTADKQPITPKVVCDRLKASGMTLLWIPKEPDFVKVEAMPVGLTGKLDLKAVKEIALREARQPVGARSPAPGSIRRNETGDPRAICAVPRLD